MKIIKFGGTSIATPENIYQVFTILQEQLLHQELAVVFSAFGGVTESLLSTAKLAGAGNLAYRKELNALAERHLKMVQQLIAVQRQARVMTFVEVRFKELEDLFHGIFLIKENSAKTLDYVASFGERLSTFILAEALSGKGLPTTFVDARDLIRTNNRFGQARVDHQKTTELIKNFFAQHKGTKIITGFIASTENGETTTLGRSGSDYTASIFASALDATAVEIWTDVSGVLTSDPNLVYTAITIPHLSYNEAMELSHFGAKVIFPATMQPVMKKNIPIYIKNTFEPENKGTIINGEPNKGGLIKGISSMSEISLVTVQGTGLLEEGAALSRVFKALAESKIKIILISQASSEQSICLAIKTEETSLAKKTLEKEFTYEIKSGEMEDVSLLHGLATLAVVGENMRQNPGTSGRLFRALGQNNINVVAIAQGSSELNISAVIPQADLQKALNALHEAFFLSETKVLHVFLVGTGLIGTALMKMIAHQQHKLVHENELDIQIHGLANSRFMAFHEDGFNINQEYVLNEKDQPMDLDTFIAKMEEMNFSNSVFVDCTASQDVADRYARILEAKVGIVTPNKKANSSSLENYRMLKRIAKRRGVKFLYETNVAAGLPVINTLQDLMLSGDKVIRIEAVLSGSMNFIFSTLENGAPFSEVVRVAKEKGFTEPDPRDDLSGMDVARKILILGREAEQELEFEDITIQSMVPEDCMDTKSVVDFFEKLKKHDPNFSTLLDESITKGERLRFMATLEGGKATVGLKSLPESHPFSTLKGSDNMILMTTDRYNDRPMIIRGPGAGADVTAAGVFADVIRIGNYTRE